MPTCWRSSSSRRCRRRRPEAFRATPWLLALVLGALGVASFAAAQGLGEAAAREQERRAREGKASPAPSFTAKDLEAARIAREGPPKPSPSPGAKGASPKPTAKPTVPPPEPALVPTPSQEPYWRGRAAEKRRAIADAQLRITALQDQLTALRNDLSPTGVTDPFRLQTQQAEIAKVSAALVEAQRGLERARQEMADLEEEARRAGALPGWLRE